MKCTFDNVLLREIKKELKTDSGIILTQDIEKGNKPAYVEVAGPDCLHVKTGDTVYVNWKDSVPVTIDGIMGVIVSEKSILGVK